MLPLRVTPPITYCQTLTFSDALSTNHVRMFQTRNLSFPLLQQQQVANPFRSA